MAQSPASRRTGSPLSSSDRREHVGDLMTAPYHAPWPPAYVDHQLLSACPLAGIRQFGSSEVVANGCENRQRDRMEQHRHHLLNPVNYRSYLTNSLQGSSSVSNEARNHFTPSNLRSLSISPYGVEWFTVLR